MAYLYILKFDTGRYYVGSTTDVERRIVQHKNGHTRSTKQLGSTFSLVFSQEFPSVKLARRTEIKIKSWKRRDFIEKIVRDGYIKAV